MSLTQSADTAIYKPPHLVHECDHEGSTFLFDREVYVTAVVKTKRLQLFDVIFALGYRKIVLNNNVTHQITL